MKKLVCQYETDWLASRPVFYNEKTLKASHNINDVIDFYDIELHPEGFNNFLDFGYSVFEQTPVKNVKFLRHSSVLKIFDDNTFKVEYLSDPVDAWFGKNTNEDDVLELLMEKIAVWERSVKGEIVLPLSGGFDSRLLASMISDKSRFRCFTYGISPNQVESYEVVHAKKIAEIMKLNWQHIELGRYHEYFDDWNKLFGVSTHAHGMYHIEFYKKILSPQNSVEGNFLSGIIGDAWAGNIKTQTINSFLDIYKLGYSHGLSASSDFSLLPRDHNLLQSFYADTKEKLQSDFYQIVTTMRLKIILLSYLVSVPESFGFTVFAPYLDMETALSMLCLPAERRKNRQWQRDYFKRCNLDIENMQLKASSMNTLDYDAAHKIKVSLLDHQIYDKYIHKKYLDKINSMYKKTQSGMERFIERLLNISFINKLSNKLRIKKILHILGYKDSSEYMRLFLENYNAYLTLKPLEYLFKSIN